MTPAPHHAKQQAPGRQAEEQPQPPWLLSFADFVSCLLASFVLLFSMVSVDRDKFQRIIGSIPGRAHLDLQSPQPVDRGMLPESADPSRSPDYLLTLLKRSFEKDAKLAGLRLVAGDNRVIVALPAGVLITELNGGGGANKEGVLFALGGALRSVPNEIVVVGKGVPASDRERWGKLFLLTQLAADAIERAGVAGPIPARTELAASGSDGMQVDVVVTERAAR